MPLVKRSIEPRHLCRGVLPDRVSSELECVTNSTLAAVIKQLGSLSRHAEDIFGELFKEANGFCLRMSHLQERVDLLAVKVTQLDSTVEEVSLQDINMRKAFKSSTTQDQQVVSRASIPNPVMEIYHCGDKPPPLNILTPYRPVLLLQPVEGENASSHRGQEEREETAEARNRRQEWNVLAYDKEFRPDARFTPSPYHGMSSEGSLSPDNRSMLSDVGEHSYPGSPIRPAQQTPPSSTHSTTDGKELILTPTQTLQRGYRSTGPLSTPSGRDTLGRIQPSHTTLPTDPTLNGPRPAQAKDYSNQQPQHSDFFIPPAPPPPPPPLIPSAQTAFDSPTAPSSSSSTMASLSRTYGSSPPAAPPPPPSGPPMHPHPLTHSLTSAPVETVAPKKAQVPLVPMSDARSDLLAAIRRGIQLRKVQEQRELEAKKEPVGNDVATILSRRIAVEYSESDEDSEPDENEWSD
ncbi:Wiskott-Aldrich syndrome protein family member 3 [Bagarius yarrelli]|uniref:Wiskott-Aldrich syndrome protein family member n=1 Tax=Bagarius yarrelli TaxID=175774 RepID=A0A556U6X0_BAGYA|nr:Wiskott-Aldrich syndrome protein family member 3 [Bagarius yarrelli]